MAVRWVRWLAPFQTLSRADQLLLLQESWKELFLLYLAQWSAPWDIDAVLTQRLARHRLTDDLLINTEVKTIQVQLVKRLFHKLQMIKGADKTVD